MTHTPHRSHLIACVRLSHAAPTGLSEVVALDSYLEGKFGADFIRDNLTSMLSSVAECLRTGQQWAEGGHGLITGDSGGGSNGSSEQLTACMKELKLKNKWKKQPQLS